MQGRPFYYFAYGAAVSEVVVDTLTGEWKLLRADVLHDAGTSLNPAIDIGQVEGGFIQGMGWLTTEELVVAPRGRADDACAVDLQEPGTIGGGHLEWQAVDLARHALLEAPPGHRRACIFGLAQDLPAGARAGPVLRWRGDPALRSTR
jgi:hypothetical protein